MWYEWPLSWRIGYNLIGVALALSLLLPMVLGFNNYCMTPADPIFGVQGHFDLFACLRNGDQVAPSWTKVFTMFFLIGTWGWGKKKLLE